MTANEEILLQAMRYIASISTGQVKRAAEAALSTVSAMCAQQVAVPAREPLTFNQIDTLENRVYMQTTHKGRPMFEYVNAIIRAVEAHHGITGAKP
jgi:hypothetical protein